jgi:hypothetical protein
VTIVVGYTPPRQAEPMGSNAHRILMDAPYPVLAVKAVDHD